MNVEKYLKQEMNGKVSVDLFIRNESVIISDSKTKSEIGVVPSKDFVYDTYGLSVIQGELKDNEMTIEIPVIIKSDFTVETLTGEQINYKGSVPELGGLEFYRGVVKNDKLFVYRYAPLHGHSGYSLLDGASHIADMVDKSEYAMALTDHGNMYGSLDFYKRMKKSDKQPIIGCEIYLETKEGVKDSNHLIVLAETNQGYKNLVKLVSKSYENIHNNPHVKWEWLEKYSEGLIVTSGCFKSEINQHIINGNEKEARLTIEKMIGIFGKDNFFFEIQRHGVEEEKIVNSTLISFSKEMDVKLIATTDSHYTNEDDREAQEILLCIDRDAKITDENRFKFDGDGYHIHKSNEMVELFLDIPEALDNTLLIADRCSEMEIEMNTYHMPEFAVPAPFKDEESYFNHLTQLGFDERFKGTDMHLSSEYIERLDYERSVINKMGFAGYFLIMCDVIKFALDSDILVGPGRGSACGSLVAYVLRITDVDPIEYGLLFERFLNEDRYSMPDIDTDFQDDRREEVIEYCREKYGSNAVARIMTVTRLTAKSVLRDVTKVLDYPYSLGSKISGAIPNEPGMTISKAFEQSPEFDNMYKTDDIAKYIIDLAIKLENTPKTTGIHACGVVISPSAVDDFVPTYLTENEDTEGMVLTTMYDKDQNEECGLLKMDFLGLRTMGVVAHCLKDVNQKRIGNGEKPFTFGDIPKTDIGMYKNIASGNTSGVFQLEQPGMTKFMTQLFQDYESYKDEDGEELYERLFAGISLYRPGPMDEIPNYLANMVDSDNIVYDTNELEPILKNTYGIIVYQEQCMRIVRDLGGFSRGQSDIIRKGMAKKVMSLLDEYGPAFIHGAPEKNIEGAVPRGMSEQSVSTIWEKMVKFSKYAFNKSHAVGYAYVSAATGYLATYYPAEYMTATMNSFISKSDKVKKYISSSRKIGIEVLPPSVNGSKELFTVKDDKILFGLKGIRSMGKKSGMIIRERERAGEFKSYKDFIVRMALNETVSVSMLNALTYAGALDDFSGTRKEKIERAEEMVAYGKYVKAQRLEGNFTLFDNEMFSSDGLIEFELNSTEELTKEYRLEKEKEFAGFYITGHPIEAYPSLIKHESFTSMSDLDDMLTEYMEQRGIDSYTPRKVYSVAGVIVDKPETRYTKRGDIMKTFTIEDMTGELDCIAFSDSVNRSQDLFEKGQLVFISGKVSADGKFRQIAVNDIVDLHELRRHDYPEAYILHGKRDVFIAREQYREVLKLAKSTKPSERKIPLIFEMGGKDYDMGVSVPIGGSIQKKLLNVVGRGSLETKYSE